MPRFPGGGEILFSGDGVGVLAHDGTVTGFGHWNAVDAFWDPLHPRDILVNPYTNRDRQRIREYRLVSGRWQSVGSWPAADSLSTAISADGKWFAYNVFAKGRETRTIRVAGRDGTVRDLRTTERLAVVSWAPDGRVVLSGPGPSDLSIWDPFSGSGRLVPIDWNLDGRLPPGIEDAELETLDLAWSADGRFFAARVSWPERKTYETGMAVGSTSKGILKVIPTGWSDTVPTWSPVRPEVAYMTARRYPPRASLHIFDPVTGRDTMIRHHVPNPWWVAWSPRGDWLLLDDEGGVDEGGQSGRWLFISRDGRRTVAYPWLGSFPRWASPDLDLKVPVC